MQTNKMIFAFFVASFCVLGKSKENYQNDFIYLFINMYMYVEALKRLIYASAHKSSAGLFSI